MKKVINNSGQSLIEFLMTLTFVIGIFFIFVNIAFNAVDGYLVHYATFMASRTYMVADSNSNDIGSLVTVAESKARQTFSSLYITAFGFDESALTFNSYNSNNPILFVGCYFDFQQRFSILKFIGGDDLMSMRSESFLGKEPGKQECLTQICKKMNPAADGGRCGMFTTYFDNGC